jgi:hypothetical protein
MNKITLFLLVFFLLGATSCTVFQGGGKSIVKDLNVQLKINSLHAKQIQESGVLGSADGDEIALLYSVNAYDGSGKLIAVNNGLWGIREIKQDVLLMSDQFDALNVFLPMDGSILVSYILIEIDDYKGERKMAKIRDHTKSIRYPKLLKITNFDEDMNRTPIDLIDNSLAIAGYKRFKFTQMDFSLNDNLGSNKQAYSNAEIQKNLNNPKADRETFEFDGSQVNEKYQYVLKFGLDVKRNGSKQWSD